MKKLLTKIALVVAGFSEIAIAQQDPQFTQFMFNKLIYNPGYAGTTGAICGVGQYRKQYMDFPGAPTTRAFAADMRLTGLPLGVGVNFMSDQIGAMSTSYFRLAGSYNITKIAGGTLGIGLDIGIMSKSLADSWIVPEPLKNDPSIPGSGGFSQSTSAPTFTNNNLTGTRLDAGFGAFYQIPGKFYAGISSTHLPASLFTSGTVNFKSTRHYYMMTGYTFQLNRWSKLTPNVMYRTDLAAGGLDLNLTYLWSDMIWVGGTYRVGVSPCILAGYTGKFGLGNAYSYKIGYSYDFTPTQLKTYAKGSHEFILGVCYAPPVKKATTYGNDRFLD
jgi:type IX secretion system PorP/SprF family membrane protein